jgi:hypothetical protein
MGRQLQALLRGVVLIAAPYLFTCAAGGALAENDALPPDFSSDNECWTAGESTSQHPAVLCIEKLGDRFTGSARAVVMHEWNGERYIGQLDFMADASNGCARGGHVIADAPVRVLPSEDVRLSRQVEGDWLMGSPKTPVLDVLAANTILEPEHPMTRVIDPHGKAWLRIDLDRWVHADHVACDDDVVE